MTAANTLKRTSTLTALRHAILSSTSPLALTVAAYRAAGETETSAKTEPAKAA